MSFKTIIWATDGSNAADTALPYIKDLGSREGASVIVVHSVERFVGPHTGFSAEFDEAGLKTKIEGQVAELVNEGIKASFTVAGAASLESPAHTVSDVAREMDADLIVAATRGHNALSGLLLGSVTHRLIQIAPCPVLAVPVSKQK